MPGRRTRLVRAADRISCSRSPPARSAGCSSSGPGRIPKRPATDRRVPPEPTSRTSCARRIVEAGNDWNALDRDRAHARRPDSHEAGHISIRKPTSIEPTFKGLPPAVAPSNCTTVASGNIAPPFTSTRCGWRRITKRYSELGVFTRRVVPGSSESIVTPSVASALRANASNVACLRLRQWDRWLLVKTSRCSTSGSTVDHLATQSHVRCGKGRRVLCSP